MAAAPSFFSSESLRRRRVEFPSKEEGVNLVGELAWPPIPRSTSTTPVAVLAHGLADDRDSFVLPRLVEELALRAGCASLRFDFRGNGESGGEFKFGNAATPDGDPADLEAAVEFLVGFRGGDDGEGEREWKTPRRFEVVALLGHSKAGSAVVSYAARRRRGGGGGSEEGNDDDDSDDPLFVPRIINVAGRFDHGDRAAITSRFGDDIFERVKEAEERRGEGEGGGGGCGGGGVPFRWRVGRSKRALEWRLTAADLEDRLKTDMGALCAQLPPQTQLLCVHGTEDATVPPSAAERYREAAAMTGGSATTTKVVLVEGADHNFTQRDKADQLIDTVVEFISEGISKKERER